METDGEKLLDLIAYRKNVDKDASISQGVEFFAFLRKLTTDGFYSSEIGIKDLQYMGNTFLKEFPGCIRSARNVLGRNTIYLDLGLLPLEGAYALA